MDDQMSSYPEPDSQQHYTLYPAPGQQQLLDPAQQEQLQFSQLGQLGQAIYPKAEGEIDPNAPNHIEQRIEQLQQQPPHPQPQHQHQHPLQHHEQHHDQHQHQQAPLAPPPPPPTAQPQGPQVQGETPQKANRLRKACDSCSIRKVKCDESGPPCRACAALDIPCTFERPSRRRGPPNRHAEAIKRRRLEESPHISGQSTPSSPTHAAQALAALSSHPSHPPISAESICDIQTLDLLVNDFFTYVHPLCPFPHEPSFREAWKRREDYNNRAFLALLSSMVAALVASFPRKPRLHLKAQRRDLEFPNHMTLVLKCQKVCADARGPGYLDSENLSVHDAATSYFLGLAACYTFRWRQCRLYWSECLTIIRALGLHKPTEQNFTRLGMLPAAVGSNGPNVEGNRDDVLDNITLEMGRRIFWTMFVSSKTIHQCGSAFSELVIPPETPSMPYPPLPVEVDDFCIFPGHIEPQPPGLVPMIAGFNANVRIFMSYSPLSTMELAWGIDALVDIDRQKKVLRDSLERCKSAIRELPPVLVIWPTDNNPFANHNGNELGLDFSNTSFARDPATLNPNTVDATPEDRRRRQYEIQKANIHGSGLCTRSYIVEKYFTLIEAQARSKIQAENAESGLSTEVAAELDGLLSGNASSADALDREMSEEREGIVRDLLSVLSSIDRVNMEPNADSLTTKIRVVASTLLEVPKSRKGQVAQQAEQYLAAFLEILVKLERVDAGHDDPHNGNPEEAELRHWADLREYQLKFAQQGGLSSLG
ncbi:MAG: Alpha/beta-hydrolase [Aureobasidium pullulans]|nr:hypothetical protein JADG_000910 [Aureobasidium pullulans]OBW64750.1 MAG: Alpha/beta-hydrolase [Aureobasidium pullulans]THV65375.1 hypothetical protein D6D28_09148 [Aureobasidium pullulans]THV79001.1 hypothetical protein D6D29_07231 [Aureobasidium pullulans]THV94100.1 hypothetical protein D6D27_04002 [Aureobasidium pullulans]